jgi:hypothetical protein
MRCVDTSLNVFLFIHISSTQEYDQSITTTEDSYIGHGVQVVVGHYNGKLPDGKKPNLTSGGIFMHPHQILPSNRRAKCKQFRPNRGLRRDGSGSASVTRRRASDCRSVILDQSIQHQSVRSYRAQSIAARHAKVSLSTAGMS